MHTALSTRKVSRRTKSLVLTAIAMAIVTQVFHLRYFPLFDALILYTIFGLVIYAFIRNWMLSRP